MDSIKLPNHIRYNFTAKYILSQEKDEHVKAYYHILSPTENTIPIHRHNFYEINIITEGEALHYVGDEIYPVKSGAVFVIPPNIPHGYCTKDKTQIYHIIIDTPFLVKYNSQLISLNGYFFLFDVEPIIRQHNIMNMFLLLDSLEFERLLPFFDRMSDLSKQASMNTEQIKEFLLLYILSELCSSAYLSQQNTNIPSENIRTITTIMEYISQHHSEKINFREIATQNNMSYSTFFRQFTKICHQTPIQYLAEYRINEALKMMRYSKELSITEIAINCGFYDYAHFSKTFEKQKGCTPQEYIKFKNERNS